MKPNRFRHDPVKVKAYRLIGYENRLLNDEDFNDDKKDAGEMEAGHSVTVLYEIIPAGAKEETVKVDKLKYQETTIAPLANFTNEMMALKFRYKLPDDTTSKLIVHPLVDTNVPLEITSENFRFSAAVAEFGMLLRDSKFKGTSEYKNVATMARQSKGTDEQGWRGEFVRLVETAELLSKSNATSSEEK